MNQFGFSGQSWGKFWGTIMITRIIIGFVAAVIAVVIVHQPIVAALGLAGVIPGRGYNLEPLKNAPTIIATTFQGFGLKGWPILFNLMFWGGLWGALYGAVLARLPGPTLLKGLLLAALVIVVGGWLLVPLARGEAPFAGLDMRRMIIGTVINGPFAIATAYFYNLMRRES